MTRKIFLSLFLLSLAPLLFAFTKGTAEARLSVSATGHTPFSNAIGLNNIVYVAGFDCGCLDAFDVTDKLNPVLLSTTITRPQPGFVITNGNYVSVGTYGGYLQTWDMTDPSNPVFTNSDDVAANLSLNIGLGGKMRISNGFLFTSFIQNGYTGPGGVIIFDLSNPAAPVATTTVFFGENESGGGDVLINGNDMYATDYIGYGLKHYNISDILHPVLIQEITGITEPLDYKSSIPGDRAFEPWGLMKKGNALYLLDDNVMQVYDISSSTHMVYATTTISFKDTEGFGIFGNILYYSASFDHIIAYYDVTNELAPTLISYTSTGAEGSDLDHFFTGSNNYWLNFDSNGYYYVNDTGFDTLSVYEPLRLIPSVLSLNLIKNNTASFAMSLPSQPASNVTVTFATTTAGIEPCVATSPSSIVFTPANWHTQQTLTINSVPGNNTCDFGTIIFIQPVLSSSDPYYNSALVGKIKTTIIDAFSSSQNSLWNLGPTWGNVNSLTPGVDYPASSSNAVIKSSVSVNRNEEVNNITITNDHELQLPSPYTLSVYGILTNDGSLQGAIDFIADTSSFATSSSGTISGSFTRKYIVDATTTKDFTTDDNRDDWIVTAQGTAVNIENATYDVTKNIFKAVNNGYFTYGANPGGKVVPAVSITTPVSGTTTIRWQPVVNWDDSVKCEFSFDNFVTTHTTLCSNNGSDITKPSSGGTTTLYVRGTNSNGSLTERNTTFVYDNTVPISTLCGSDLLDEVSRPYYYLTGNINGDCKATVNTELRGASTTNVTGFTVTGNIIATSTTSGIGIALKNITVTGQVFASGASNNAGGGYNGGAVTIATSTTGSIFSNGGNGTTQGGSGGNITITSSIEIASSTPISATGGNATVCGRGGNGGTVNLINSTYGAVSINAGTDQTVIGNGLCQAPPSGSSGSTGSQSIVGIYSPPSPNNPTISPTPQNQPSVTPTSLPPASTAGSIVVLPVVRPASTTPVVAIINPIITTPTPSSPIVASIKQIVKGTEEVVNSPVSKTVQTVGFFAGLLGALSIYMNALFATPLLAGEALLIPIRLWGLFLVASGLKKRTLPWGTVYDSITKRPIDPAFVTVRDMSNKVVAQAMTDIDGRYGFFLPDGKYTISAEKTNYEFPSKKMVGKPADEVYRDLYFGEKIEVKSGEVIDKNIPLDPVNFDWNEQAKIEQNATEFHKKNEKLSIKIANYVFRIGTVISLVSLAIHPSLYNIAIVVIYGLVAVLSRRGIKGKKLGNIRDRITGKPFAYAIFRVTGTDHETVLRSGACDAQGRYYCIVPKGEYYVDIEQKNKDGSYTKVYQSSLIPSRNGIINTDFAI